MRNRNNCPSGYQMVKGSCVESNIRSIGNINPGDSTMGFWGGAGCDACMQQCFNQMSACSGVYSYPLGGQCSCNQSCAVWTTYFPGEGMENYEYCSQWQYMCFYAGPSCGSQCASACPTGWGGVGPNPGSGRSGGTGRRRTGGKIRRRR